MAFANVRQHLVGGGLRYVFGDFTATAGAASQTYAVGGGRILMVHVNPQGSTEPVDFTNQLYSISISGGINTLTIYTSAAITAGSFFLVVDAGG